MFNLIGYILVSVTAIGLSIGLLACVSGLVYVLYKNTKDNI